MYHGVVVEAELPEWVAVLDWWRSRCFEADKKVFVVEETPQRDFPWRAEFRWVNQVSDRRFRPPTG